MAAASRRRRTISIGRSIDADFGREHRLKRLLTIGHSYVVAQNRRLAHEMAVQGSGEWEVTAVAPARLQGDLRHIELEHIPGEACSVVPLDLHLGSHPHLRMFSGKLRGVLQESWDVVHGWEEPYVVASAQIARGLKSQTKFVPATFQNIRKRYPLPIAMLERHVMKRADAWIAFGETVHAVQRDQRGYQGKPSKVLSPGVDVESFRPDPTARAQMRKDLGWTTDDPVVGFAGRFVAEKGIDTILHAFEHSKNGWNLLFVGGGSLEPQLASLRQRHPSRVRVAEQVSHDDMPKYFRSMDVLCAPSRTTPHWREQFGRMLIEAMACGVPVIASDSGEIPHVVQRAGVVLPEDDFAQWAEMIDRMAIDVELRKEFARLGLERAQTEFSWPVVARRHLEFFNQVLAE